VYIILLKQIRDTPIHGCNTTRVLLRPLVKIDIYENRVSKQDGFYLKLTEKLKEIDLTADVNTAKTKINTSRSNYRRELNKVLIDMF